MNDVSAFIRGRTKEQARTTFLLFACFLFSLVFPACRPAGRPAAPYPAPAGARPRVQAADLEQRIHQRINLERRLHGLKTLAWDDALSRIARKHSSDMGKRRFFSHDSPEGHDFSYRYRKDGYRCGLRIGNTIHLGAENIFQNNLYDSVTTVNGKAFYDWNSEEKIAETTVRGWMNSPGHRKNILTPHWEREGIGVFIAPDDKIFITQNFC